MQITISRENVFWLIDELLARWRSNPKKYPFNRPDAIIPQNLVPEELRREKRTLANWYLAICNHMKGRVESVQAFRDYARMWKEEPQFFDPLWVALQHSSTIEAIYRRFIATDRRNAAKTLMLNYRHLLQYYGGDARNVLKGAFSYDDAIGRLMNKRNQKERFAGKNDPGFYGFRHKMVSMFVYFMDWEGFLKKRFPYPAPADIQNFRIGIASQGIQIPENHPGDIRNHETISAPWRKIVLEYVMERNEDSIAVADVLWLFSNVMCGNSPLTTTFLDKKRDTGLFSAESLPHERTVIQFTAAKHLEALQETCLSCFLLSRCKFAIPAQPYYDKGIIELRERPKIENVIPLSIVSEPKFAEPSPVALQENFLPDA